MHTEARGFVASKVDGRRFKRVVEIGGRNVNGSVRDLFDCDGYTSVDVRPGAGVDVVADGAEWQPERKVDCVVCCETLEHTPDARRIVENMVEMLRKGGTLLITAACDPRPAHSGNDGTPIPAGSAEFYRNVDPDELTGWVTDLGLEADVEVHGDRGDVYLTAKK